MGIKLTLTGLVFFVPAVGVILLCMRTTCNTKEEKRLNKAVGGLAVILALVGFLLIFFGLLAVIWQ